MGKIEENILERLKAMAEGGGQPPKAVMGVARGVRYPNLEKKSVKIPELDMGLNIPMPGEPASGAGEPGDMTGEPAIPYQEPAPEPEPDAFDMYAQRTREQGF